MVRKRLTDRERQGLLAKIHEAYQLQYLMARFDFRRVPDPASQDTLEDDMEWAAQQADDEMPRELDDASDRDLEAAANRAARGMSKALEILNAALGD